MKAWKLFSLKKDGSIGPLFINKKQRLTPGVWYEAEEHKTKGFAFRPGWHCCVVKITWGRKLCENHMELCRYIYI